MTFQRKVLWNLVVVKQDSVAIENETRIAWIIPRLELLLRFVGLGRFLVPLFSMLILLAFFFQHYDRLTLLLRRPLPLSQFVQVFQYSIAFRLQRLDHVVIGILLVSSQAA